MDGRGKCQCRRETGKNQARSLGYHTERGRNAISGTMGRGLATYIFGAIVTNTGATVGATSGLLAVNVTSPSGSGVVT